MEKFVLKSQQLLISTLILGLSACGPVVVDDIKGLDNYSVIAGNFEENDDSSITGTGTLRFTNTLPGISSSRSFSLKASLDDNSMQSSVTALFYTANQNMPLSDGVAVSFTRSGAGVVGEVRINGFAATINNARLSYYFPSSLDVVIDIDNTSSRSRVLIWRRDIGGYLPDIADVDTSRNGDLDSNLPNYTGNGMFAGLIVRYSTIKAAQLSLPKYQH